MSDFSSAGALLRQARLAKGLELAALAAAIKVPVEKLTLLEADHMDQLPGSAFVRALTQTICRYLDIESAPVMALLPASPLHSLDRMSQGLNQPFHDGLPHRKNKALLLFRNPIWLGALALMGAALVVYWAPKQWLSAYLPHKAEPVSADGVVTQIIAPAVSASQVDAGTPLGTGTTVTAVPLTESAAGASAASNP